MKRIAVIAARGTLLSTVCASVALGQQLPLADSRAESFADVLGFERADGDSVPEPWIAHGNVTLDREVARSGLSSARVTLRNTEPNALRFQSLRLRLPIDFVGTNIEWRGFRRAENFSLGIADPIGIDWIEFSVTVPIDPNAHTLELGIPLISARGVIWLDDLEILVDGLPLHDIPRVPKAMPESEIAALIARAERAGPRSISNNATIKTVHSAEIKVLREGSNGWVCWAEPLREEPMCNEPGWDNWLLAFWNQRDSFEVDRFSTSYMLAGPRPHIMTLVPNTETLEGLSPFPPVYVMFGDTPYGHIMLETGQERATEQAGGTYGPSRTQQIMVAAESIIPPFAPIEMSMATLERYTGTYEITIPRGLPDELSEGLPANLELPPATVSASAEGLIIRLPFLSSQTFLPISETIFMDGTTEAAFELDEDGNAVRLMSRGETYQRID